MKKVGFFMILGAAILLLFGCAGNGGLGGVSQEPVDDWFVTLLYDGNGDGVYDSMRNYFYINIDVNADNDGYVAVALDEDGELDQEKTATFSMDRDEVEFTIAKGSTIGIGNYLYNLTGIFYDVSTDSDDLMAGDYEDNFSDDEGFWFAVRYEFPTEGVAFEGYNPLEDREEEIERLIEEKTGYKVDLDFSELTK